MPFDPKKTHVAVLKGGWSAERPVSLVSGVACAKALAAEGFRITEIDAGHDLAAVLAVVKPDVVFNALHGEGGEDGCVQGLLEVMQIPYTHSGVLASSVAMNKERAKQVFRAAGLPIVKDVVVDRRKAGGEHLLPRPYVVKPVAQGSSVGVFIVRQGDNRPPRELLAADWNLGERVMVEEFVPGRELSVAVLGDRALGVTEIVTDREIYDYEARRYLGEGLAKGGSKSRGFGTQECADEKDMGTIVRSQDLKRHVPDSSGERDRSPVTQRFQGTSKEESSPA